MRIKINGSVLVGGVWHEPGIGSYDPKLAQHLIDIGVAEAYEAKIVEPEVTKRPKKSGGASQPARASRKRTRKKSEDSGNPS